MGGYDYEAYLQLRRRSLSPVHQRFHQADRDQFYSVFLTEFGFAAVAVWQAVPCSWSSQRHRTEISEYRIIRNIKSKNQVHRRRGQASALRENRTSLLNNRAWAQHDDLGSRPVLRQCLDRLRDTGWTVLAFCVADTSSHVPVVLNWPHEHYPATLTPKPGNQLWGIYYTDREYARLLGDPLRTVVEALTKSAAEEAAGKLGFESPWAHPVNAEQAIRALRLPQRKTAQRQSSTRKHSHGIHV